VREGGSRDDSVAEGSRDRADVSVTSHTKLFLGHGGFAEEAIAIDDFAFLAPDFMNDAEAEGFAEP
jgi:hypothetical protein